MTGDPVPISRMVEDVEQDNAVDYARMGARLREARKLRGLTLHQVATQLRVSEGFISHVEGGRKRPSVDVTIAWAQLLGLSPPTMLNLAGHLTPEGLKAAAARVPFHEYIEGDPNLTQEQRHALIVMYRSYVFRRDR